MNFTLARDWTTSEHARGDQALLRWSRLQLRHAAVTYQDGPHLFLEDGSFPQWSCQSHCENLFALGRVRRPLLGEEGFTAVVEVAFRGTETTDNWVANLNFSMVNNTLGAKVGRLHRGFSEAYLLLRDGVEQHVVEGLSALGVTFGPEVLVLAKGHSLGGALATLSAYDLATRGCTTACVTFGAPRVGDEAFKKAYELVVGRTLRFVNKFDQVPRLPPSTTESVTNDADLFHHGVGAVIGALGLSSRLDAEGYCHVAPARQLDACGVSSSIDHWANVAVAAGQRWQARRVAATGSAAHTDPPETVAVDHEAIVPHRIAVYERNIDNLLEGNAAGKAGVGVAVATAAARLSSLYGQVQAARSTAAVAAAAEGASVVGATAATALQTFGPPPRNSGSQGAILEHGVGASGARPQPSPPPPAPPPPAATPSRSAGWAALASLGMQALVAVAEAQQSRPPVAEAQQSRPPTNSQPRASS